MSSTGGSFVPYNGSHALHRAGEDAVGLRISIFCSEGFDPSLEGIITSYDHETGQHGILFDTGVQLDIDISKERVMLEQPPHKERPIDDNLSDILPEVAPLKPEHHHYPEEVYRHSRESRQDQLKLGPGYGSRYSGSSSRQRQGSFNAFPEQHSRGRGYSNISNPELMRRDSRNNAWPGEASPEVLVDTESNWSRSSYADQNRRRREEIIGLRVIIFHVDENTNMNSKLEGMVVSYDDHTGLHGVLFDSGVELDVDLHEERIKLSRNRRSSLDVLAGMVAPNAEIEEDKKKKTDVLRQWIVENACDITLEAACRYALALYHHNIPSCAKLAKKLTLCPLFLVEIGIDEVDSEEIMNTLRKEYPSVPLYSPTTTTTSSISSPTSPHTTTLQSLFTALHAQQTIESPNAAGAGNAHEGGKILASAVAALTGKDPIPSG